MKTLWEYLKKIQTANESVKCVYLGGGLRYENGIRLRFFGSIKHFVKGSKERVTVNRKKSGDKLSLTSIDDCAYCCYIMRLIFLHIIS